MKLGVDAGNSEIKIYGEKGAFKFSSIVGEYRERKLKNSFSDSDIVFEFRGRKGFAGKLAEMESEFSGSLYGTTKAHEDTLIRVLIGLTKYGIAANYQIVVGQPIEQHTEEEKQRIKQMLIGAHEITVNDVKHEIRIERVEVAAESGAAFWSNPKKGLIRILDFGSGTVNGASLLEGKYIDRDSFTCAFGLNTIQSTDKNALMRAVFIQAQQRRWNRDDKVFLVGGAAEELLEYAKNQFSSVELLKPKIVTDGRIDFLSPIFANAVGMYRIAEGVYV